MEQIKVLLSGTDPSTEMLKKTEEIRGPGASYLNLKKSLSLYNNNERIQFDFLESPSKCSEINIDYYDIIHIMNDTDWCTEVIRNLSIPYILGPNIHIESLEEGARRKCYFFYYQKWVKEELENKFPGQVRWLLLKKAVDSDFWKQNKNHYLDFFIPGKGYKYGNFDEYSNALVKYGRSLGLKCEYLKHFHKEEYLYYLNRSKFVVFPSHSEHISNSMLESLSTNTPVIIYDNSNEFFNDKMGYSCISYSIEDFKKGIDYMINNWSNFNSREYIVNNYNFENLYLSYVNAILEVVGK